MAHYTKLKPDAVFRLTSVKHHSTAGLLFERLKSSRQEKICRNLYMVKLLNQNQSNWRTATQGYFSIQQGIPEVTDSLEEWTREETGIGAAMAAAGGSHSQKDPKSRCFW